MIAEPPFEDGAAQLILTLLPEPESVVVGVPGAEGTPGIIAAPPSADSEVPAEFPA